MGQIVDPALDRYVETFLVAWMGKCGFALPVRLRDYGSRGLQGHGQNADLAANDGAGEDLHAIRATLQLPPRTSGSLVRCPDLHGGQACQEITQVDWGAIVWKEGRVDRQYVRT